MHPEAELGNIFALQQFAGVPHLRGVLNWHCGRGVMTLALLQDAVSFRRDAWQQTVAALAAFNRKVVHRSAATATPAAVRALCGKRYFRQVAALGTATAALHRALAAGSAPEFVPVLLTRSDRRREVAILCENVRLTLRQLRVAIPGLPQAQQQAARQVLTHRRMLLKEARALAAVRTGGRRLRLHGDYHLGQVLVTAQGPVVADWEGATALPLADRRSKQSPLRDAAGIVRSFDYVCAYVWQVAARHFHAANRVRLWMELWRDVSTAEFLAAYRAAAGSALPPLMEQERMLRAYLLEKALYEVRYELHYRPDWLAVPLNYLTKRSGVDPE